MFALLGLLVFGIAHVGHSLTVTATEECWAGAEPWIETNSPSPPGGAGLFGAAESMDLDGSRLAVAAWKTDADLGAAYVYDWNGTAWDNGTKFVAPGARSATDRYGWAVSVSGEWLAVGAYANGSASEGAVYLYRHNVSGDVWTLEQTLSGVALSRFGYSVSVDGDHLLVGAQNASIGISQAGKVFAFAWNASSGLWEGVPIAHPGGLGGVAELGYSVLVRGTRALSGAPGHLTDRGRAHVYEWSGTAWTLSATLVGNNTLGGPINGRFGHALALYGDEVFVGAPFYDAGDDLRLIFLFDTFDEIANDFLGWMIDDVRLLLCADPGMLRRAGLVM